MEFLGDVAVVRANKFTKGSLREDLERGRDLSSLSLSLLLYHWLIVNGASTEIDSLEQRGESDV